MERNAKYVVRLDERERGRLQEMVDRGQGSKTIRNRTLILEVDPMFWTKIGPTSKWVSP